MRRFVVFSAVLVLAMLAMRVLAQTATEDPGRATAFATVVDVNRAEIGVVRFEEAGDDLAGVRVTVRFDGGLPPGFHGFHLHNVGSCEDTPEGMFMAAGVHYNPDDTFHPDHAGDFPTLLVTGSGQAYLQFVTDRFTVDELFDADGSSVIVHANPDNYGNIPARYGGPDAETLESGDSGMHIACGVLERGTMMTDMDDDDDNDDATPDGDDDDDATPSA